MDAADTKNTCTFSVSHILSILQTESTGYPVCGYRRFGKILWTEYPVDSMYPIRKYPRDLDLLTVRNQTHKLTANKPGKE